MPALQVAFHYKTCKLLALRKLHQREKHYLEGSTIALMQLRAVEMMY